MMPQQHLQDLLSNPEFKIGPQNTKAQEMMTKRLQLQLQRKRVANNPRKIKLLQWWKLRFQSYPLISKMIQLKLRKLLPKLRQMVELMHQAKHKSQLLGQNHLLQKKQPQPRNQNQKQRRKLLQRQQLKRNQLLLLRNQ